MLLRDIAPHPVVVAACILVALGPLFVLDASLITDLKPPIAL